MKYFKRHASFIMKNFKYIMKHLNVKMNYEKFKRQNVLRNI